MTIKFISKEVDDPGHFKRQRVRFTTPFRKEEGQLSVEKDCYRLIVSYACPWAHRQLVALKLLGLENVINVGVVNPIRPVGANRTGWEFSLDKNNTGPILGVRYLSELYLKTDFVYQGRFTVPAVVGLQTKEVVNSDFYNLLKIWETDWTPFHSTETSDLYPEELRADTDVLNEIIFHDINNGVYKAGFATSQKVYEEAYDKLFRRLDELEERLAHSRYLFDERLTDSDIRLYVSLVRFDIAYYNGFRCNRNRLIDFPNLWGHARDLYQQEAFKETINFNHIKKHYHLSAVDNPHQILSEGLDLNVWDLPHDRTSRHYI